MISKVTSSPTLVRVVPFVIFLVLTYFQGKYGDAGRFWIYFGKTVAGAWMLAVIWRHVQELEWRFSWEAVIVGVGIFAIWVALEPLSKHLRLPAFLQSGTGQLWNPHQSFGEGTAFAWFFVAVRTLGSTFVVAPLEELFYRSFLYRYLWRTDFLSIPLNKFIPLCFFITSAVFAVTHGDRWLVALLCGFAYQGLVLWKNRLGDAITAHAITNFLLALWVVWRDAWHFWD